MGLYLVDRDLPGITVDQLAAAQRATISASAEFTAAGTPIQAPLSRATTARGPAADRPTTARLCDAGGRPTRGDMHSTASGRR